MKKRFTLVYAIVLSALMLAVSVFVCGCNKNTDSSGNTNTDAATTMVIAAAEKTAALLQNEGKYTIEEIYENYVSTSSVIKCDGTKIGVKASASEIILGDSETDLYGYYEAINTDNGVKYYMYMYVDMVFNSYVKTEITEEAYKMANSVGASLSAMFPTFTQSKWVQGENADTFTSTISANGAENSYAVKIVDGYIVEIKSEMNASSVNMTMIYKIYDIGTTTVELPTNVQEISADLWAVSM